jgi:hypothetical protein
VQGRIRVHRKSCRFVAQGNPEKRVNVWWEKAATKMQRRKKHVVAKAT